MQIDGKVIIATGASNGSGLVSARLLGAEGRWFQRILRVRAADRLYLKELI